MASAGEETCTLFSLMYGLFLSSLTKSSGFLTGSVVLLPLDEAIAGADLGLKENLRQPCIDSSHAIAKSLCWPVGWSNEILFDLVVTICSDNSSLIIPLIQDDNSG